MLLLRGSTYLWSRGGGAQDSPRERLLSTYYVPEDRRVIPRLGGSHGWSAAIRVGAVFVSCPLMGLRQYGCGEKQQKGRGRKWKGVLDKVGRSQGFGVLFGESERLQRRQGGGCSCSPWGQVSVSTFQGGNGRTNPETCSFLRGTSGPSYILFLLPGTIFSSATPSTPFP